MLRHAALLAGLSLLCGCESPAVAPSAGAAAGGYIGTSALSVAAARTLHVISPYATVRRGYGADSKYYEYVNNDYGTYADVFDYPAGTKAIGYIHNVGGQGCTNVLYGYGKKTFWIVAGPKQISEYAVPHQLLRSLHDSIGAPSSCAMDTHGDLAVGILHGARAGDVIIFPHAIGSGKVYSTGLDAEYFDAYDPDGNLFADGFAKGFKLVELPAGSSTFVNVTLSDAIDFPGSVQWDGKYLDVNDQYTNVMHRYTVSGAMATLKGTVMLLGSSDCAQTWIATGVVYCADAVNNDGEVFKYPAGGSPIASLSGNFDIPLGTVAAQP